MKTVSRNSFRSWLVGLLVFAYFLGHTQTNTNKTILALTVDNDFFFYIDRYYSSGVKLSYSNKALGKAPIKHLLLPSGLNDRDYYSLSLLHNIYTPENTLTRRIASNDRPYASYLLIGISKKSFNYEKKTLLISSLNFGVIGSVAGAEQIQNTLHEFIPIAYESVGWHHQIKNDVCIMYNAAINKGLINTPYFEVVGIIKGSLGVPHTEAAVGAFMRFGTFTDYFRGIGIEISDDFNAWLYFRGYFYYVHYNATLQGGTYNQNSDFTYYEIAPTLLHGAFGAVVQYKGIQLEYGFEVRSPEFKNAWWHRWGHIEIAVAF